MTIEKYGSRYWAVYDDNNTLICVTVYKKGAKEVLRRLAMEISEAKILLSKANALNILREKHETILL